MNYLTLYLSKKAEDRIWELQRSLNIRTKAELIRKALTLLSYAVGKTDENGIVKINNVEVMLTIKHKN